VNIPLFSGFELGIASNRGAGGAYPTAHVQKGFLLIHNGQDLSEEGVGFGVPVLKRGFQTIFPGDIVLEFEQKAAIKEVTALFKMNLVERIARPGKGIVKNRLLYKTKDLLAAMIRSIPPMRSPLTSLSNLLRQILSLETTFRDVGFCSYMRMVYTIDSSSGFVKVVADTSKLADEGFTEVIVMNEQGAHWFDQYTDSNGIWLRGKEIGCWDEVFAKEASFVSDVHQVAFTLTSVGGARLFRGRELIGSRLAWAGFGYSFPPTTDKFVYKLNIRQVL
jgi:hypothetical protein